MTTADKMIEHDILGLCIYKEYNNRNVIGIRGIGETYDLFYKWLYKNRSGVIWEHSNWPWHYIVVDDEIFGSIILRYGNNICYDDEIFEWGN